MIEGQSWHFFQPRLRHLVQHEQKNAPLVPWTYPCQYGVQEPQVNRQMLQYASRLQGQGPCLCLNFRQLRVWLERECQ